jgi:hypothetical protein
MPSRLCRQCLHGALRHRGPSCGRPSSSSHCAWLVSPRETGLPRDWITSRWSSFSRERREDLGKWWWLWRLEVNFENEIERRVRGAEVYVQYHGARAMQPTTEVCCPREEPRRHCRHGMSRRERWIAPADVERKLSLSQWCVFFWPQADHHSGELVTKADSLLLCMLN